jgi:hypothetical protein
MKFRTQLVDVHPLLAAIRKSPFWQEVFEAWEAWEGDDLRKQWGKFMDEHDLVEKDPPDGTP